MFDKMGLGKSIVVMEVLGIVAVYAYYKKIENDFNYRQKLYQNNSKVLEGTLEVILSSCISHTIKVHKFSAV